MMQRGNEVAASGSARAGWRGLEMSTQARHASGTRLRLVARVVLLAAVVAASACASGQVGVEHAPAFAEGTDDPAALFTHGRELARRGDPLRGEQYMVMAVRAGYPEERAIVDIVGACLASARLRAALGHAMPFLRRHPQAWRVRQLVGALHLSLGQPQRARLELLRVVAERPDAAEAHYLLAVLAQDTSGDHDAVRRAFAAYLQFAPQGRHAAEARGWLAQLDGSDGAADDEVRAERAVLHGEAATQVQP